jgi:hypothetical protein
VVEIRSDIVLFILAALIVIIGIHNAITNQTFQHDKGPNGIIERYINGCWIAKTSKNLNDCRMHLAFIQNQCETNLNYSKAVACKDPRLVQLVKEENHLSR